MDAAHKPLKQILLLVALAAAMHAQRVFEQGDQVVYEDAGKRQTNLGLGFNPILTANGRVVLLRGRRFDYGENFDCTQRSSKNWVDSYDPEMGKEVKLFDQQIRFYGPRSKPFCVFSEMQISHDSSTLYLLANTDAAGGSLAIIKLRDGATNFVHGVEGIWIIESGPHMDELIYQHRLLDMRAAIIRYPLVHARADGRKIKEISEEWPNENAPILRKYLRDLGATIYVNGRQLP